MKLNARITDLLFNLSELEAPSNVQFLLGEGTLLRNNLLKLYRATQNGDSHKLIIKIMAEAGYPWFAKLAQAPNSAPVRSAGDKHPQSDTHAKTEYLMSEDEFMELLPANGHFH